MDPNHFLNSSDAVSPFIKHAEEADKLEHDPTQQKYFRLAFSVLFIFSLLSTMFYIDRGDNVMKPDECLRDYTFIWTDGINQYLE